MLGRTLQRSRVRQRPSSVRGRYLAYARTRSARHALILRKTLALWSFRGKRRLRRRLPRRQYRKLLKKKPLSRFLRKHRLRVKKFRLKRGAANLVSIEIIRKRALRLKFMRFRRGRNSGRAVVIRAIRRRW